MPGLAKTEPNHILIGMDSTGAAMTRWECPLCKMVFERRKPCVSHLERPSCRKLVKEDETRRASIRAHMAQVARQGYDDMWVWSPEKIKELQRLAAKERKEAA